MTFPSSGSFGPYRGDEVQIKDGIIEAPVEIGGRKVTVRITFKNERGNIVPYSATGLPKSAINLIQELAQQVIAEGKAGQTIIRDLSKDETFFYKDAKAQISRDLNQKVIAIQRIFTNTTVYLDLNSLSFQVSPPSTNDDDNED